MQSYLVSGEYLSRVDIAGLERVTAPAGVYLSDGKYCEQIDGVTSFTRSPQVWLWMFQHYRSEQEIFPGIFGLRRDDSNAVRIAMRLHPLTVAKRSYPIRTRRFQVDLGDPGWPAENVDFLRLRLTVHYSFWWRSRKPARLMLDIERADLSHAQKAFIVKPNGSSEVWFYPWDDAELSQYFNPDVNQWRLGPRPAITHLRLLVMPLDWVSVQPDTIEVQAADAVRVSMNR